VVYRTFLNFVLHLFVYCFLFALNILSFFSCDSYHLTLSNQNNAYELITITYVKCVYRFYCIIIKIKKNKNSERENSQLRATITEL